MHATLQEPKLSAVATRKHTSPAPTQSVPPTAHVTGVLPGGAASAPDADAFAETWVVHATEAWSLAHLECSREDVVRRLLSELNQQLASMSCPALRLSSGYAAAHRWRYARTTAPLGTPFLWDVDARLAVCGDWTHGARVEDAFTSGDLLARAMLDDKPLPMTVA